MLVAARQAQPKHRTAPCTPADEPAPAPPAAALPTPPQPQLWGSAVEFLKLAPARVTLTSRWCSS